MKKPSGKLVTHIQVRLTLKEKNRIKGLSELYAGGNMSLWIVHSALNGPREFLFPKGLGFRKTKRS
jgi:hypothetical protein